jgi:DNA segregation ATPase FtsK/SpoIIIE-like protein
LTTRGDYLEFVQKFPDGAEVAVRKDDGAIVIGTIDGVPKADDHSNLVVHVVPENGDLLFTTGIDQIRPRQIEKKKSVQKLRVALTDAEKMEAGHQIADLQQRGSELTGDMKSEVKRMKAEIDSVTAQMLSHGERLRTGYELRSVDCELVMDYDRGTVTEIRKDTGEIVNTRGLYPSEQTQVLPGEIGAMADNAHIYGPQTQEPAPEFKAAPITDKEIEEAIEIIKETRRATTATITRRMKIKAERAAALMDALEQRGIVGPPNGDEPRDVLIPMDE